MPAAHPRPHLREPPIVEVACGFEFEPIEGLDALWLGRLWGEAFEERYPHAESHPPLDRPGLRFGPPDLRAWFVSDDGAFVVQVQNDRFVFNWRRPSVQHVYPRFRDHEGGAGVHSRACDEFERFVDFITQRRGITPRVRRLALTKVDLVRVGEHWSSLVDVARLVPGLGSRVAPLGGADVRTVDVNLTGERGAVSLHTRWQIPRVGAGFGDLRWDTTAATERVDPTKQALLLLNEAVNEVFFDALSSDARALFEEMSP